MLLCLMVQYFLVELLSPRHGASGMRAMSLGLLDPASSLWERTVIRWVALTKSRWVAQLSPDRKSMSLSPWWPHLNLVPMLAFGEWAIPLENASASVFVFKYKSKVLTLPLPRLMTM
jgi:hypothetical protein